MNYIIKTMLVLFSFIAILACQDKEFQKEIDQYRTEYKNDFDNSAHAPLKAEQLDDMRFFRSDKSYQLKAKVTVNDTKVAFDVPTSSGMIKEFQKYADASFRLKGKDYNLEIYQNLKSIRMPQYKTSLFLPFKDHTNGAESYGGGRYIDLKIEDIVEGELTLDFNKAYNPYCAYSAGYNCPIPPLANHLDVAIEAGEKMYAGEYIGERH